MWSLWALEMRRWETKGVMWECYIFVVVFHSFKIQFRIGMISIQIYFFLPITFCLATFSFKISVNQSPISLIIRHLFITVFYIFWDDKTVWSCWHYFKIFKKTLSKYSFMTTKLERGWLHRFDRMDGYFMNVSNLSWYVTPL